MFYLSYQSFILPKEENSCNFNDNAVSTMLATLASSLSTTPESSTSAMAVQNLSSSNTTQILSHTQGRSINACGLGCQLAPLNFFLVLFF